MVVTSRRVKRQVKDNSKNVDTIQSNGRIVFNRRLGKSKLGSGAGGSAVFRAVCTDDAGSGSTIPATLFNSDGTTGDAITVYCNISNGTALNSATPRLEEDDDIFITKSTFDNAGTPVVRWYCVTNFQATEDCTCGT